MTSNQSVAVLTFLFYIACQIVSGYSEDRRKDRDRKKEARLMHGKNPDTAYQEMLRSIEEHIESEGQG